MSGNFCAKRSNSSILPAVLDGEGANRMPTTMSGINISCARRARPRDDSIKPRDRRSVKIKRDLSAAPASSVLRFLAASRPVHVLAALLLPATCTACTHCCTHALQNSGSGWIGQDGSVGWVADGVAVDKRLSCRPPPIAGASLSSSLRHYVIGAAMIIAHAAPDKIY